jgi:hypothetical protein
MAVICVPPHDPWKLARWAYRLVLGRLLEQVDAYGGATAAQDRYTAEQARALDGLNLDLLLEGDRDQAARLARYLHKVAGELQPELRDQPDQRDRGLAEVLAQLERQLLEFQEIGYVHVMRMKWGTDGKMPRFKIDGRDYHPHGVAVRAVIEEAATSCPPGGSRPSSRPSRSPAISTGRRFRAGRSSASGQPGSRISHHRGSQTTTPCPAGLRRNASSREDPKRD